MMYSINPGSVLLAASALVSLAALVAVILTAAQKLPTITLSRRLYLFSSACIAASLVLLFSYFINCDFRFAYVYENSSRDLPLPYRIAAVWAGKEGSFLLWLFFLNIFGLFILRTKERGVLIISSVIILTQLFIMTILIVEGPFIYMWTKFPEAFGPGLFPGDGEGLNPLLKDPWMVAHPPVLFLGYASAAVPFAYAFAGLWQKDKTWIKGAYPWLLFSMVTLGVGIFLGGYWAYTVLGWGGYWGWDAVENSSLVPWIIALALIHGLVIQKKTGMLVRANLFFSLMYFLLVLYSTWLTRSGVLSNFSVHSFAASRVSPFLLLFVVFFFLGSMTLYFTRVQRFTSDSLKIPLMDWRTLAVYGIIVLIIYAAIILIGTSLPLITSVFMERASSATADFYNNFSAPFGFLIIALMIASTALSLSKNLLTPENAAIIIISIILGAAINAGFTKNPVAYVFAVISFVLIIRSLLEMIKTRSGSIMHSRLTHIGVGLLLIGIVTSNFHTTTAQKKLIKGKEEAIERLRITFNEYRESKESSLRFTLKRNSEIHAIETAYYLDEKTGSLYKEPYVMTGFFHDTYIAPEIYESGAEAVTQLILAKGEEKELGGLKTHFIGFRTEHMTSGEPITYAELLVNGMKLVPGVQFKKGTVSYFDRPVPGTDRTVSLREIDATSKRIALIITPGKSTVIPADTVIVSVTKKRLIWLVWLGTVVISIGGCYTFAKALRKKG